METPPMTWSITGFLAFQSPAKSYVGHFMTPPSASPGKKASETPPNYLLQGFRGEIEGNAHAGH